MIEIHAKLLRGPVYFPDETIQCLIKLRNVPLNNNDDKHSELEKESESSNHSDNSSSTIKAPSSASSTTASSSKSSKIERLCWTNVQLHCFCIVDDQQINADKLINDKVEHIAVKSPLVKSRRFGFSTETTVASKDTSFHECLIRGEKGIIVYSSKPKILFCDLQLLPGESQTFVYSETLPTHLNPSYYSARVKYIYKLTIGAQRIGSAIRLFKIPIRLLRIDPEVDDALNRAEIDAIKKELLEDDKQESTQLDVALHRIEMLTCQRKPHTYNITSPAGKVAKFFIYKNVYRVGEEIVGSFNFYEGTVPCIKFVASLICEETINDDYLKTKAKSTVKTTIRSACCREYTLNLGRCGMIIPIPFHVTPTFSNALVSIKWSLHFRFTIPSNVEQSNLFLYNIIEDGENDAAPRSLDSQVLTWDIPIRITPTHPSHVARGFQMVSSGTMNI